MESFSRHRIFVSLLLLFIASTAYNTNAFTDSSQLLPRALVLQQPSSRVPLGLQQTPRKKDAAAFSVHLLHSTSSNGDETTEDSSKEKKLEKKIADRKKRVETGYKISASVYAAITCIALAKYRAYPIQAASLASGIFVASSASFYLIDSASNDRVNSIACKRLNLALASFGFIGLLAKDIVTTARPSWVFGCLVTTINSIKGYGYGLKGWDLGMVQGNAAAAGDIAGIFGSSIAALFDIPGGVGSAGYAALAVTFDAMKLFNLYKIALYVCAVGTTTFGSLNPLFFRFKKFMLFTVAAFTLKEAAEDNVRPKGLGLCTSVATGITAANQITRGSLYLGGWLVFLALFSFLDSMKAVVEGGSKYCVMQQCTSAYGYKFK